jgi:hypothetical protein
MATCTQLEVEHLKQCNAWLISGVKQKIWVVESRGNEQQSNIINDADMFSHDPA